MFVCLSFFQCAFLSERLEKKKKGKSGNEADDESDEGKNTSSVARCLLS